MIEEIKNPEDEKTIINVIDMTPKDIYYVAFPLLDGSCAFCVVNEYHGKEPGENLPEDILATLTLRQIMDHSKSVVFNFRRVKQVEALRDCLQQVLDFGHIID